MMKTKISYVVILSFLLLNACKKEETNESNSSNNNSNTTTNIVWKKDLALAINPAIGQNYMPAVDENDNIYVLMNNLNGGLNSGHTIQAFDKTGKELWKKVENTITSHNNYLTYFQNKLFYTSAKKIVSMNALNGSVAWEYNLPDSMQHFTSSLAIVENKVLITLEALTAKNSYLFALNPSNGEVIGKLAVTPDRVWLNMAAKGNTVYLAHGHLYKVTVNSNGSMSLDWKKQLPGNDPTVYYNFEKDIVIAPNGNVTFAYSELANPSMDILISYNSSGEKLWEYDRQYSSRISLDEQGNIYDGGPKDLIKIDGTTGQKVWAVKPPSEFEYVSMGSFTSMIHAKDGIMYCGDTYGIYGANYSGNIKYSTYSSKLGIGESTPFTDVAMLSNGYIIVMAMGDGSNGSILCLNTNTQGISTKGWPKRGANAANTFNINN